MLFCWRAAGDEKSNGALVPVHASLHIGFIKQFSLKQEGDGLLFFYIYYRHMDKRNLEWANHIVICRGGGVFS